MIEWSCGGAFLGKDPEICRLCREAVERMDNALDLSPQELTGELDIAENAVARLRDILIDRYRRNPPEAPELLRFLERVNLTLSFMAGVVYPVAGINRSVVEKACKVLKEAIGPCDEIPASRFARKRSPD